MRIRKYLLGLRIWRLFRREVKLRRSAEGRIKELGRTYRAKFASEKAFYEKRLAQEQRRGQLREDALLDRVFHAFKLMGVGHLGLDLAEKTELPPSLIEEDGKRIDVPELNPDQQDYLDQYKQNFFQMGTEAGTSASEIEALWQTEYEEQAVDEAIEQIET